MGIFSWQFLLFCVVFVVWFGVYLSSLPWHSSRYHRSFRIIGIILLFAPIYLIGGGYWVAGTIGAFAGGVGLLPCYFIMKLNSKYMQKELLAEYQKLQDISDENTTAAMHAFCMRLRQIAGTDKVLMIVPTGAGLKQNPQYQMLCNALGGNIIIEKRFPLRDDTILRGKNIARINAEIQKSRACKIIVFFNVLSITALKKDLEQLAVIVDLPDNSPLIVIFGQRGVLTDRNEIDCSDIPVEYLHEMTETGAISEILLLLQNAVWVKDAWRDIATKALVFSHRVKKSFRKLRPEQSQTFHRSPRSNPTWTHAEIAQLSRNETIRSLEREVLSAIGKEYLENDSRLENVPYQAMAAVDWRLDDFLENYRTYRQELFDFLCAYWSYPWDPKDDDIYPEGEEPDKEDTIDDRVELGYVPGASVIFAAMYFLLQSGDKEGLKFLCNRSGILCSQKYLAALREILNKSVRREEK